MANKKENALSDLTKPFDDEVFLSKEVLNKRARIGGRGV